MDWLIDLKISPVTATELGLALNGLGRSLLESGPRKNPTFNGGSGGGGDGKLWAPSRGWGAGKSSAPEWRRRVKYYPLNGPGGPSFNCLMVFWIVNRAIVIHSTISLSLLFPGRALGFGIRSGREGCKLQEGRRGKTRGFITERGESIYIVGPFSLMLIFW